MALQEHIDNLFVDVGIAYELAEQPNNVTKDRLLTRFQTAYFTWDEEPEESFVANKILATIMEHNENTRHVVFGKFPIIRPVYEELEDNDGDQPILGNVEYWEVSFRYTAYERSIVVDIPYAAEVLRQNELQNEADRLGREPDVEIQIGHNAINNADPWVMPPQFANRFRQAAREGRVDIPPLAEQIAARRPVRPMRDPGLRDTPKVPAGKVGPLFLVG